jgi:hypothetical protein
MNIWIICFIALWLVISSFEFESQARAGDIPSSSASSANWEPFHDIGRVNTAESLRIIDSLSVKSYWDVLKGEYRVGLMGDDVLHSLPEYVNVRDKQSYLVHGKNVIVSNVSHVDYSNLLMHLISCVQHLHYNQHSPLQHVLAEHLSSMNDSARDFHQKYKLMTADSHKSSKTLHLENQILEQRIENDLLNRTYHHQRFVAMEKILLNEQEAVAKMFDEFNSRMEELVTRSLHNQSVYQDYFHQLLAFEQQVAEMEVHSEIEFLEAAYKLEEAILMQDFTTHLQTVSYRLSEESRIAKLTEPHERKLLTMQYSYGMESMQAILSELFDRLSEMFVKSVIDQPMLVFRSCAWTTAIILLLLFVFETIKLLCTSYFTVTILKKVAFQTRFVKSSSSSLDFLNQQLQSLSSSRTIDVVRFSPAKYLIIDDALRGDLDRLISCYTISLRASLPLPSVLIYGASGLGKSHLIDTILASCKLSYVLIRGYDLISLQNSGQCFQQAIKLIRRKSSKSSPCLVILDDADRFIQPRTSMASELVPSATEGTVTTFPSTRETHDCFYILLEEMRQSSPSISFILLSSSSCNLQVVDAAILDRIDQFIELASPVAKQRLDFLIMKTIEFLNIVISADDLNRLTEVHSHENDADYQHILSHAHALQLSIHNASIGLRDLVDDASGTSDCDIRTCLAITTAVSSGWSYRDLGKLISNIRTEGLGSESCKLTTRLWLREVERKYHSDEWHN